MDIAGRMALLDCINRLGAVPACYHCKATTTMTEPRPGIFVLAVAHDRGCLIIAGDAEDPR